MAPARRLVLLLAVLLGTPASAYAANADVAVRDDFFDPSTVQIQPGDTVTWRWSGLNQHNVSSDPNQSEDFHSEFMIIGSFSHTFSQPGRFTYFCEVHPTNMRGAVEVGSAPFPDTTLPRLSRLRARTRGSAVRLSFRLSEEARVKVSLRGPSRRSATRSLSRGSRSVRFRRLREGRYRATLRPTDTAGNRGRAVTKRFRIN
jgi:plastocyanin